MVHRVLAAVLALSVPAVAGDLIITKTDSSTVTIPTDQIQSITFHPDGTLPLLVSWMTGAFSSAAQADTSSDPYHYAVLLYMVRIWDHLAVEDGYWVYVEQAMADTPTQPYRQRIYRVFEGAAGPQDEIYTFPGAGQYAGAWQTPEVFDALTVADLTLKDGCDVFFEWQGTHFYGATQGAQCASTIPGVSYITTETTIHSTFMTSWDLGYNENGDIVMGPYSPYLFDKLQDFPIGR